MRHAVVLAVGMAVWPGVHMMATGGPMLADYAFDFVVAAGITRAARFSAAAFRPGLLLLSRFLAFGFVVAVDHLAIPGDFSIESFRTSHTVSSCTFQPSLTAFSCSTSESLLHFSLRSRKLMCEGKGTFCMS